MKKCMALLIAIVCVLGLIGCSDDISSDHNPSAAGTNVDQLKETYPMFFDVPTDDGLTVYVWQPAENTYRCYLANTAMEAVSDNSFAYDVGATMAEMRAILTTYDIKKKDITVQPVTNPLSSYYYEIDEEYRTTIKEMFWNG